MDMINYLLFIATAILIFVSFRAIRLVSHRIRGLKRFYPVLVALELTFWMSFLFWIIQYFLSDKAYYNELILVLVITLVILLVWFYIKDVVAGFLFRIKHNPGNGQFIYLDDIYGVIKKMAPSQIYIEREGGEVIRMSYSMLMGKSLSLKSADSRSASEVIIRLAAAINKNHLELEKQIKVSLLQSPWCVPGKPIKIIFLNAPEEGVEIALHLLDKSYAEAAKSKVSSLLSE
jgi:hypothetical protein